MTSKLTAMNVTWRMWDDDDTRRQPRRKCSTPGCQSAPVFVKETHKDDGKLRLHAYCFGHSPQT